MNQVHKENLTHVENANPGRQGLEIEIFGMEGVPAEIIDQHNQQVTQAHFAEEQERARVTGNPIRGLYANGEDGALLNKRPKVTETLEEIEQRADKYRTDRKNGVLPAPKEVAPSPVRQPHPIPRTPKLIYLDYSPLKHSNNHNLPHNNNHTRATRQHTRCWCSWCPSSAPGCRRYPIEYRRPHRGRRERSAGEEGEEQKGQEHAVDL
jgi:hypothetical protein